MKVIRTLRLVGGALMAAASVAAWSQTSEPAAAPAQSSIAPASEPSAKATKQANRGLSKKVLHALSNGGVNTSGINVTAKGGAIVLAGHVPDSTQIDKASKVAKSVPGVTSVKNALSLKEMGQ
ncbi:transport-associated protein [Caballeronia hypogeia]|uniref:Transport-associated protein n=1 Tax=Caballeronia hypogeia TaxID=1777140 RepID=A0A158AP80_9BURK|nr:BON domain-containing protein [Caballeronia hypogeia]SAK59728.1 transport-associated protein [Caballeronia hypogeia]